MRELALSHPSAS